jgi:hypothetical protein
MGAIVQSIMVSEQTRCYNDTTNCKSPLSTWVLKLKIYYFNHTIIYGYKETKLIYTSCSKSVKIA